MLTEIRNWTAARAGAALTIRGEDDSGPTRLTGVGKVTPNPDRPGTCVAWRAGVVVAVLIV